MTTPNGTRRSDVTVTIPPEHAAHVAFQLADTLAEIVTGYRDERDERGLYRISVVHETLDRREQWLAQIGFGELTEPATLTMPHAELEEAACDLMDRGGDQINEGGAKESEWEEGETELQAKLRYFAVAEAGACIARQLARIES